jgi:hypothetical protein
VPNKTTFCANQHAMREFATVGRFSEHADVAVTAPVAFDYVTDQSTLADWNDHVTHAEVIDGGAVRLGSRLRQQRRRNNREFDLTFEVTRTSRRGATPSTARCSAWTPRWSSRSSRAMQARG